jgi:hypothetical protein
MRRRSRTVTVLTQRLAALYTQARERRSATGARSDLTYLAELTGLPERDLEAWLRGDGRSFSDDELLTLVGQLALWAEQPPPDRPEWRELGAAAHSGHHGRNGREPRWRSQIALAVSIVAALAAVVVAIPIVINAVGSVGRDPIPFGWTVSRANAETNGCWGWQFARPISTIPVNSFPTDSMAAEEKWALHLGGSDVEGGTYSIILQGKGANNVVIQDVRVKVIARKPARPGTIVYYAAGCGGGLSERYIAVNLSSPALRLTPVNGATTWPFAISGSDTEDLLIGADLAPSSLRYEYYFVYEIDWVQGSHSGTVTIDAPNGQPFTAQPILPGSHGYIASNGKWIQD